jgi:hypothetical protein
VFCGLFRQKYIKDKNPEKDNEQQL